MNTFTDKQIACLQAKLNPAHVERRQGLDYIEAWRTIDEANRIFGFGEWSRETVLIQQLGEPYKNGNGNIVVNYMAKVRITIISEGHGTVIREGSGFGSGINSDLGQAHEGAIKEAESDAMKRALMTFGYQFGLALYDKTKANVEAPSDAYMTIALTVLKQAETKDDLAAWWKAETQNRKGLSADQIETLKTATANHAATLPEPKQEAAE